jgi:hypothetical protein
MSTTGKVLAGVIGLALVLGVWVLMGGKPEPQNSRETAETAARPAPLAPRPERQENLDMPEMARSDELSARRNAQREARAGSLSERRMARSLRSKGGGPGTGGEAVPRAGMGGHQAEKGEAEESAPKAAPSRDDDTFESVRTTALSNPDPDERIRAIESLSLYDDEPILPVFAQALRDTDPEVRLAALEELSLATDSPPLDLVGAALNDSDPEIRSTALQVLADSEDEGRWPLIRSALRDPDEDVRAEAQEIVDLDTDEEE